MGADPKKEWLKSQFLDYQLDWIYDPSAVAIALKARQIGFSDGTAGRCIFWGHYSRRPQIVISASQNLADELLATVRTHCEILAALGNRAANQFKTNNSQCIEWKTGGRVIALSASERTSRSFHGDVYFDEFAFHMQPERLWAAAAPMASNGDWRLRVISTPNGAQGKFHEWCTQLPKGWSLHETDINKAEKQGKAVDREKLLQLVGGDERLFNEAYLCQFLDASLQYFPTSLVTLAREWVGKMPPLTYARWFAGLDVGRMVDISALSATALDENVAWLLAVMTAQRTKFSEQQTMVRHAREVFQWEKIAVDQTGLGAGLAESMVEEWGESEVIPVQFTAPVKEELFTRTFRWLKNGAVRLPKDDTGATIARQLIAARRVVTKQGQVVYRFGQDGQSHSDELCSFMLSLNLAGEPPPARGVGTRPVFQVA